MIRDGALQNPTPQGIIGLHVHPGLPYGKLSFRKGRVMASADELYVSIKSSGGHAATPHQTVDTVLVAAQLITSLQTIISRNRNPQNPSVLSICSIHGGNTTNVIPSEVKLMGTFRAMDETWRFQAHELMMQQAKGLAIATGAEIDFRVDVGYPTVDNEPMITEAAWKLADQYMGANNVEEIERSVDWLNEQKEIQLQQVQAQLFEFPISLLIEYEDGTSKMYHNRFDTNKSGIIIKVPKKVKAVKLDPNVDLFFEEVN
jgi:hippurate hydrolase